MALYHCTGGNGRNIAWSTAATSDYTVFVKIWMYVCLKDLLDLSIGVSFANACHSARVTGLPLADGLVCIPAETEHLPKGALVEFIAFEND